MPLKVAHLTPVYPPYAGGIGVVAQMMAEGLAERGWQVEVMVPEGKDGSGGRERKGVKVNYLKSILKIGNAALVPQLSALEGYNIIHLHYPFFGGAEWLLGKGTRNKEQGTKFIVQYHHDADAGGLKGLIFKLYDAIVLPRLIARADKVIVSSMDYARHSRVARFMSDKFLEIPFGVDTERFKPCEPVKNERRPTTILFVGSLDRAHWFKGLEILFNALVLFNANIPPISNDRDIWGVDTKVPWRCMIVGDGDFRPRYERMVGSLGIADRVRFLGSVSHDQLPEVYRNADLFVFPSVSRAEAFGLVVLEAMASGLPVIVSDLPGVRTLIADQPYNHATINHSQSSGFTFPVGDHRRLAGLIATLASDASLHADISREARARALERYTTAAMTDKIEKLYAYITH
ncbi:hypothetical protein A3J43_03380 [Candidatus Uhrbacteria bacterium RIFCSPHIGHO2_12_FULL_54_23]|uniref:Glycosyltransferase subfamily 4-like N-terminal domain-containing protein n=3 Tax=Candidatus Uhriibacteriota TaxID=1752732 RepID=A0A1F7UPT6_9BACT|nr:MAG: hypothetical protein A3J43_03380 [Candidatus Uhrbacteria bacterium RIFCSPHIGHO2_12_FULL_54_23]OGL85627.1 MAG: hypothetical protein A3B36_01880 [Candidatus Uhrbacteria bacterium RIFCSPLOWO2_01_FULL_55_36]OGL91137.1 MAG: hypothetical protein A3J36_03070 [Candidatus Uhrbacteria bacterium RIFCSPLOWO2_02_FULL_54_37]